jgi:hypothetical protein
MTAMCASKGSLATRSKLGSCPISGTASVTVRSIKRGFRDPCNHPKQILNHVFFVIGSHDKRERSSATVGPQPWSDGRWNRCDW